MTELLGVLHEGRGDVKRLQKASRDRTARARRRAACVRASRSAPFASRGLAVSPSLYNLSRFCRTLVAPARPSLVNARDGATRRAARAQLTHARPEVAMELAVEAAQATPLRAGLPDAASPGVAAADAHVLRAPRGLRLDEQFLYELHLPRGVPAEPRRELVPCPGAGRRPQRGVLEHLRRARAVPGSTPPRSRPRRLRGRHGRGGGGRARASTTWWWPGTTRGGTAARSARGSRRGRGHGSDLALEDDEDDALNATFGTEDGMWPDAATDEESDDDEIGYVRRAGEPRAARRCARLVTPRRSRTRAPSSAVDATAWTGARPARAAVKAASRRSPNTKDCRAHLEQAKKHRRRVASVPGGGARASTRTSSSRAPPAL